MVLIYNQVGLVCLVGGAIFGGLAEWLFGLTNFPGALFFLVTALLGGLDDVAYRLDNKEGKPKWIRLLSPMQGGHFYFLPVWLLAFLPLFMGTMIFFVPKNSTASASSPVPVKEAWMAKHSSEWPLIILKNTATFADHRDLREGTSFLVREKEGRVLAVTSRHLLNPNVADSQLEQAMLSWKMHPAVIRSLESGVFAPTNVRSVSVEKVAAIRGEVLMLTVKEEGASLPAQPLEVREGPVQVGETVYLLGTPASGRTSGIQQVYPGKVIAREGTGFRVAPNRALNLEGFSGAPIIDANGKAIGVLTVKPSTGPRLTLTPDFHAEDLNADR